ncbi:FkbM family methyltransferase [Methanobrevibacter sp. UBA412]|uniref:FkbM family methyltransferase n=1 Tax=Methanobrevibacter sp. UBA412 TaxID=1915486 RepID=UPI0039B8CF9F
MNNKEISILKESFLGEGNSPFSSDLKDKIIVDIGGNIGDTALQFAKQGAEVYSFEPVPPIYDIALKNIDLNPDLKDKIHFYNYAISNKKGEIDIAYGGEGTSAGSSTYSKKGKVYKVNTITLKDILSNLCPNVDLLQMDCEGSEYDIIPNSNLSMFKEIIIEYHQFITGIDYHVLLENLEKQGFIIDEIFPCPGEIFSINQVGIIRAINKNI